MSDFEVDKSKLLDSMGRPLTQGLFLEIGYNTEFAVYSLGEMDKDYKGNIYPSLKKLYLDFEDPLEYNFARTYLTGWKQWQRLLKNAQIRPHILEWREELEYQIRSSAVRGIIDQSMGDSGFQASKWLADRGWEKRGAGRPSKEKVKQEEAFKNRLEADFADDAKRMGTLQ